MSTIKEMLANLLDENSSKEFVERIKEISDEVEKVEADNKQLQKDLNDTRVDYIKLIKTGASSKKPPEYDAQPRTLDQIIKDTLKEDTK